MKKILPRIAVWVLMFLFYNCGSGDNNEYNPLDFTQEEKEALQVLNGTFKYELVLFDKVAQTSIITFSPFNHTQKKTLYGNPGWYAHGTMTEDHSYSTEVDEYYFCILTTQGQIAQFHIDESNPDNMMAVYNGVERYSIIDKNTVIIDGDRYIRQK